MAKAYWIANVTVTDPERYASYQALAVKAFSKYGARFLVRGGLAETLEGTAWERHVVIEFDSREQANACYNSPEYRAARGARSDACIADIAIIDGM
ncbi:DUF1330 domain-containing protein [Paracoccus saliphilus]|uniref:DUF1330 domain-containing protein n=1 Tax=Paracoccus saliphilus TaxID=405559 RepID=A0AA45W6A1_9RHOB|nr:DUF1330 domain-containing protein [Paracoccus saliphilus]WCR01502.1 DUF1330 domain-containing protein [Paracoccus saliphilus]SIS99559.1 Uncharacterized conserved protein, DUF1330 family [Paracoccus saliphilus]